MMTCSRPPRPNKLALAAIAGLVAIALLPTASPAQADDGHLLRRVGGEHLDQASAKDLCLPPPAPVSPPVGEIYHFMPVADAEIHEGNPDTNLGIGRLLTVGYDITDPDPGSALSAAGFSRVLLRHDVSAQLPRETTVHRATLRLLGATYCAFSRLDVTTITASRVETPWSEMDVTWSNRPSSAEEYGSVNVPLWEEGEFPRYNIDVTNLVSKWVAGEEPEYGLALVGPANPGPHACHSRGFYSKGYPGFRCAPVLEVDYSLPPPRLIVPVRELAFQHRCGGTPLPLEQSLEIRSSDTAPRRWRAQVVGSAPWVTVKNTSSIVAHILPDELHVSLSAPPDCETTNTATIALTVEGLSEPPVLVRVTSTPGLESAFLPLAMRLGPGPGADRSGFSQPARVLDPVPPWQETTQASEPVRFALLVAIGDYLYEEAQLSLLFTRAGAPGDGDINGSVSDAVSVRESLADPTVKRLFSLVDRNATRELFFAALERFAADVTRVAQPGTLGQAHAPETEIIVFFSGHAGQVTDLPPIDESGPGQDGLDEYFAFYDFPMRINPDGDREGFLLDDELSEMLRTSGATRYAALMDTCHAGGFKLTRSNSALLAASRESQSSIDYIPLEHGLFSYYVLRAARSPELDADGDGWLSVREIQPFVADGVAKRVAEINMELANRGHDPDAEQDVYSEIGSDVRLFRVHQHPGGDEGGPR